MSAQEKTSRKKSREESHVSARQRRRVSHLRAPVCARYFREKDALNFLFVAVPLVNVLIPVVWKSFAGVFTADCLLMAFMYYNKGAGIFNDGSDPEPDKAKDSSSSA